MKRNLISDLLGPYPLRKATISYLRRRLVLAWWGWLLHLCWETEMGIYLYDRWRGYLFPNRQHLNQGHPT